MRTALTIAVLIFVLSPLGVRAHSADSKSVQSLRRVLKDTAYVPNFKKGLRAVVKKEGKSSPFLKAILSEDNSRLDAIFARVYARHLSSMQIDQLLRFYESPTGKVVVLQQRQDSNNPSPPLRLSPKQKDEVLAFSNSAAAKAFRRVVMDKKIWHEAEKALHSSLVH